jgi:hypothetical protein
MKTSALIAFLVLAVVLGACSKREEPVALAAESCLSGEVVGFKSYCYAFKVDQPFPAAQPWVPYRNGAPDEPIQNVIGLIELPASHQQVGNRFYVRVRPATEAEAQIPEYTNLPSVPKPVYVVLDVAE